MKEYFAISKVVWLLCISLIVSLTACSSDDDENTPLPKPREEVVQFMKTNLYDGEGNVVANILEDYGSDEYNLIADNEKDVRHFFTALTGIEVPLQDTYTYTYQSADGKCKIIIEGRKEPEKGLYATIRFSVPECRGIRILHIGTSAILEGTNGTGGDMTVTGDLPHRVPGYY